MHPYPRFLAVGSLSLLFLGLSVASCGSTGKGGHGGSGAGTGTGGAGGMDGGTGGGNPLGDAAACTDNASCDGGVCVNGACCASAADVCGTECCTGGAVCLNAACVIPGNACHTAADCQMGQYCETALGGGASDAGVPEAGPDGGVCIQAPPLAGKCLPLPPVCPGDGGTGGGSAAADAGCVADCEYHPPVNATLDAVPEWTWGPTANAMAQYTDIWASPVVGRVYDTNCDGKVNSLDDPVIVFVSGNDFAGHPNGTNCQTAVASGATSSMCHTGALRMLDGTTGAEIWTLDHLPASVGFAGMSAALGDVDGDGQVDIVAATGEGDVVLLDASGNVKRISDKPIPGNTGGTFGWGGGLSIADMNGDGFPEIIFGKTVFTTTNGKIALLFTGSAGQAGQADYEAISTAADLDGAADNHLELLAGNTAYRSDGTILWNRSVAGTLGPALPDGFSGVGDFNGDGLPEAVLVAPQNVGTAANPFNNAFVWILDGATGATLAGPVQLPTTVHQSDGGPPTIANFDGMGQAEIGVATADYYWMLKPDLTAKTINIVWKVANHDYSSSVTGSTVFDFEGAGHPSVIYADECFLWVLDGATGDVRFAASHTSFTGTEASLVADIAGDGHAHLLMVSNGADPSSAGWGCLDATGAPETIHGVTWTPSTYSNKSYRGLVSFGDSASSWVGTRTLWNEHAYHVSNICDDTDSACPAPNVYGSIPKVETKNWTLGWLNNFRQNVQDKGIFNAPDAVVSLDSACVSPAQLTVSVRNIGLSGLPAGVNVDLYKGTTVMGTPIGTVTTTHALLPGQTEQMVFSVPAASGSSTDTYIAQIAASTPPKFHECNEGNDTSNPARASCSQ